MDTTSPTFMSLTYHDLIGITYYLGNYHTRKFVIINRDQILLYSTQSIEYLANYQNFRT